jgi:hypothetical protein
MSESELAACAAELDEFATRLSKVPLATRELLSIIIERSEDDGHGSVRALFSDVLHACGNRQASMNEHLEILEHHSITWVDSGYQYPAMIVVHGLRSGWPIWSDLKRFAEDTGAEMRAFVWDLRFDLLDG